MNQTSVTKKHHSLSDLARSLNTQISKIYHKSYWITAEISKLNYYPQSGHCYPQLVEKKDGKIIAEMRGMIFKGHYSRINHHFTKVTGKKLQDGMQILFQCKLSFHAVYGLSLTILDVEPTYTLGEMARLRAEAIKKLRDEGIFDKNRSLYLPMLVQKVAIISVETSKGFLDFQNVLCRSPFPRAIKFNLFSALLQGDAAVTSIISALTQIQNAKERFDAVLIIRGGGGETGLDCYDNYHLARHVCLFPIPVLTGIGHATNFTVVEQVAYKNLLTPTDLAGYLIQNYIDFAARLEKVKQGFLNFKRLWFQIANDKLNTETRKLTQTVTQQIETGGRRIKSYGNRMKIGVQKGLQLAHVEMNYKKPNEFKNGMKTVLKNLNLHLDNKQFSLTANAEVQLKDDKVKLNLMEEKLRILNPKNTLKRGYSITTINGKPITRAEDIAPGTEIETTLWKGKIKSTTQ